MSDEIRLTVEEYPRLRFAGKDAWLVFSPTSIDVITIQKATELLRVYSVSMFRSLWDELDVQLEIARGLSRLDHEWSEAIHKTVDHIAKALPPMEEG